MGIYGPEGSPMTTRQVRLGLDSRMDGVELCFDKTFSAFMFHHDQAARRASGQRPSAPGQRA